MPMTRGAEKLYTNFVRPFVLKHQSHIDKALGKAHDIADNARDAYHEHVKPN